MTTAPVTWFDRPLDTSGHICDMIRGKKKSSSITQRRREREEKKKGYLRENELRPHTKTCNMRVRFDTPTNP